MSKEEKLVIKPEDVGSLEEILGPNDPLFQPEPNSESPPKPQENKK